MRLTNVSTNHQELSGSTVKGCFFRAVFSYGRLAVFCFQGCHYINRSVWKYSSTTSKHIFSTFPALRGLNIDSVGFPPYPIILDSDESMEQLFFRTLGGVK